MEETIEKLKCLMLEWGGTHAAFKTYGIECDIELLLCRFKEAIRLHWILSQDCDTDILCEVQSFVQSFTCECSDCDAVASCEPFTITIEEPDDPLLFSIDDP